MSAAVSTTVPVLPLTDKTGTFLPDTMNDPCAVVTVMFAPASTISEVRPPAEKPGPSVTITVPAVEPADTLTVSLLATEAVTPVTPTTVTLMALMGWRR
jgi:hypothetical protein